MITHGEGRIRRPTCSPFELVLRLHSVLCLITHAYYSMDTRRIVSANLSSASRDISNALAGVTNTFHDDICALRGRDALSIVELLQDVSTGRRHLPCILKPLTVARSFVGQPSVAQDHSPALRAARRNQWPTATLSVSSRLARRSTFGAYWSRRIRRSTPQCLSRTTRGREAALSEVNQISSFGTTALACSMSSAHGLTLSNCAGKHLFGASWIIISSFLSSASTTAPSWTRRTFKWSLHSCGTAL